MKAMPTKTRIPLMPWRLAQAPSPDPTVKRAIEARPGTEVTYIPKQRKTFALAIEVNKWDKWREEGVKQVLIYDLSAHKITSYD